MVKNEENNLGDCLTAINQTISRTDVELIIVDTGSTDQTVNIAKQYTNNVYFHGWNNHFSEMRNITLSYATGEWILILDADEVFEDEEKLLKLISDNNLLKKYNTIRFVCRNVLLKNSEPQQEFYPERMFRRDGFCFEGAVHNQPRFKTPVLTTDISFLHYGYINDDQELMKKKFDRTASILKKELSKNPEDIYYRFQLSKSYFSIKEKFNSLREIRNAYNLLNSDKDKRERIYIYGHYAKVALNLGLLDEMIEIATEGIGISNEYIDLYYDLTLANLRFKNVDLMKQYYNHYVHLYRNQENIQLNKISSAVGFSTNNEKSLENLTKEVALYYFNSENYEEVLKLEDNLPESSRETFVFKSLLYNQEYDKLKERFLDSQEKTEREKTIRAIEKEKNNLSYEDNYELTKTIASEDSIYSKYNLMRLSDESEALAKEIINKIEIDKISLYYEVLSVFFGKKMKLFQLKRFSSYQIKQAVQKLMDDENINNKVVEDWLISSKVRKGDFHQSRVYKDVAFTFLINRSSEIQNDNGFDILSRYLSVGYDFIKTIYNVSNLDYVYQSIADNEQQLLAKLYLAECEKEMGNIKSALSYFQDVGENHPYFSGFISRLIEQVEVE
nr:glycosyltransferase family 2 protein [Alkalibacillus almallahensis]